MGRTIVGKRIKRFEQFTHRRYYTKRKHRNCVILCDFTIQVLEIVSSHGNGAVEMPKYVVQSEARNEKNAYALANLSQKIYQLRLYSQHHVPMEHSSSNMSHKVEYRKFWKSGNTMYDVSHL